MYPEEKENHIIRYLILVILAIAVLVGGGFIFYQHNSSKTPVVITPTGGIIGESFSAGTPEEMLKVMRLDGKIVVPKIESEKEVTTKELVNPLNTLVFPFATDVKVRSVVYDDKTTGFVIDYTAMKKVEENYDIFSKFVLSYWDNMYQTHSNLAALSNFENDKYEILAELSKYGPDKTKIRVYIVNKK